uniref:Eukaryotic translation initiation factor 3 subunit A n=1 Tax=Clastoptera arizonana TaxID=38151 RepID=A0A1B6CP13_9HEMI
MSRYGQRPENALKRANEFIEVGKPARALDTLYEVFKNKKWTYSWSESVLEPIMFKYLDLCVELKKSHIAKEGLFQYRNMFQSVNVGSLENVIRFYLRTAEERTEAAREQSQQAVIDIDDLDNLATPESILLSAVSGEDAQDRSDRTILTPWVKFLWESYCQCLELLRTNAHVETLYHDIARMAYQFCLKYNRKTEFRKLCDKLRKHLEDISKLPVLVANVSINKPETQQFNLDTRLVQLDSAIQMELWQEAYKATEDIHNLMNLSKKPPVPKTMANYYHKLAMVFWKAGYYLFHAAALFKLFQLSKEMKKNMSTDELQRMACRVLLATLSIPLPSAHPEFDRFIETDKSPLEKAQRLAVLLTLQQPPTRASLLKDVVRLNVVGLASPQLQELYNCLEVEFSPLTLCNRVQAVTDTLQGEDNLQYIRPLQDVTLVRLIRQVSQVYQTIQFSRLLELGHFTTSFHLERLLVECVRHNDMQIRIEHGTGCVHFGIDLSESQREDKPEGPTLQSMPSEQVRNQLINMSTVLTKALLIISPNANKPDREKLRQQMVQHYHDTKAREHQRILARHKIIEDRKEHLERLNIERDLEEARRVEEVQRQHLLNEQKRLDQEREERERKRQESEIQQIKERHLKDKMQQISQTSHGQKVLKKLENDDIKNLDADQIAAKEAEELQKERREIQQKLKSQEKKVDYFERAKRLVEIPLYQAMFKEKQIQDRQFWEQQETERMDLIVTERKEAVEHRRRLARMEADKQIFIDKIKKARQAQYLEKLKEYEARVAEEREKCLSQNKQRRKEERRNEWARVRREEETRKREEEERKKEQEERAKREEEEMAANAKREQELEKQQRLREEDKARRLKEEEERREEDKPLSWRAKSSEENRDDKRKVEDDRRPKPVLEEKRGADDGSGEKNWRGSETAPKTSEPWRPSINRNRDAGSRIPSNGMERRRDEDRDDRDDDRDKGRFSDRGRFDRPFEDRRGGSNVFGRDRDDDRRGGGFGQDRDKDDDRRAFGRSRDDDRRGFVRDRDDDRRVGYGRDRDKDDDRRGGFARDRDKDDDRRSGFGRDRDKDDERRAFGRDRDRDREGRDFGGRDSFRRPGPFEKRDTGPSKDVSSWRTRESEPDSKREPDRKLDWARDSKREDRDNRATKEKESSTPVRGSQTSTSTPAGGGDEQSGDSGSWKKVSGRR